MGKKVSKYLILDFGLYWIWNDCHPFTWHDCFIQSYILVCLGINDNLFEFFVYIQVLLRFFTVQPQTSLSTHQFFIYFVHFLFLRHFFKTLKSSLVHHYASFFHHSHSVCTWFRHIWLGITFATFRLFTSETRQSFLLFPVKSHLL